MRPPSQTCQATLKGLDGGEKGESKKSFRRREDDNVSVDKKLCSPCWHVVSATGKRLRLGPPYCSPAVPVVDTDCFHGAAIILPPKSA